MTRVGLRWAAAAAAMAVLAVASPAKAEAERVAVHQDWSVFAPTNPRECYIVSQPTSWRAERGGNSVQVNRGDIRLFVSFRPADNVENEVSYTGGYPFADGSNVTIEIGGERFTLGVGAGNANNWAWPASPEEDNRLVAAMRRGTSATVTGRSGRGNTTIDTFSLMGFTAAIEDARERCS